MGRKDCELIGGRIHLRWLAGRQVSGREQVLLMKPWGETCIRGESVAFIGPFGLDLKRGDRAQKKKGEERLDSGKPGKIPANLYILQP